MAIVYVFNKLKRIGDILAGVQDLPIFFRIGEIGDSKGLNVTLEAVDRHGHVLDGMPAILEITPAGRFVEQEIHGDSRPIEQILTDKVEKLRKECPELLTDFEENSS